MIARRWPRSLFGRNLLLIVGLIVLGQLVSMLLITRFVQQPRIEELAAATGQHLQILAGVLAALPPAARADEIARLNAQGRIQLVPVETASPDAPRRLRAGPQVQIFLRALRQALGGAHLVLPQRDAGEVWVRMRIADTDYWAQLPMEGVARRVNGTWLWISLCVAGLALLGAYAIQRRINRPLRQLADAARAVGQGRRPDALPTRDTPTEIAELATSFETMARDLAHLEATRREMLAGISHDLRTPLTKMRLGIAMEEGRLDPAVHAMLVRQTEVMDAIIGQFIDFARDDAGETPVDGDLEALLCALADEFAAQGHRFALDLHPLPRLPLRPVAMRRLLSNLMQNAVRHAGAGLALAADTDGDEVVVAVRDRGPGVPADRLAELTRPFVRHASGAAAPAGTGLGLAIAERIARLEGGRLVLQLREGGGLEAALRLPVRRQRERPG